MQYFQNRDVPENQEEEVWSKMRNAGPTHGVESPQLPPKEMSRENSHELMPTATVDKFNNPVGPWSLDLHWTTLT